MSNRGQDCDTDTKTKLHAVQTQVNHVSGTLKQAIDHAIARGERLEVLVEKSEGLELAAGDFQRNSRKLKNAMWWKNCRTNTLIVMIVAIILTCVILAIYFGSR